MRNFHYDLLGEIGHHHMSGVWSSALALLLVTGAMLGVNLPLAKIATAQGVPPLLWAFVISAGAGGVLLASQFVRGRRLNTNRHHVRYFVVTAAVSYAIPNMLMFTVVPHLGAGYTSIMYTLSPPITLVLALVLKVRRPNLLGIAGIGVGLVGALLVAVTRGEAGRPAELLWLVLAFLIPVSLACGNIYRTMDWPKDSDPTDLAAGSHLAAAVMLLIAIMAFHGPVSFTTLKAVPFETLAQIAAAAAMFAFYFRLQMVGGPVYLSQIGYVAAGIGLVAGTVFLSESYQLLTWAGAAVIVVGVLMTTKAQRQT
jgi:drug/metabolite transporter (DMT)-like permease